MTPKDISQIVEALREQIADIVKGEVRAAIGEIPFRVRQELEAGAYSAVRKAVETVVKKNLSISVELK
jgi:hypothetical protein